MYRAMGEDPGFSESISAKAQATAETELRKEEKKGNLDVGKVADVTAHGIAVYSGAQAGAGACAATGVGAPVAPLCGLAGAAIANELYGPVRDFVAGLFHDDDRIKANKKYRAAALEAMDRANQAWAIQSDAYTAWWDAVRALIALPRKLGLAPFKDYGELSFAVAMSGLLLEPSTNCPNPPAPLAETLEWTDPVLGVRVSGRPQMIPPDFFCDARRNEVTLLARAANVTSNYGQESRDNYYRSIEKQIVQGYQDAVDSAIAWQEQMRAVMTSIGVSMEASAAALEISRQMKKAVTNARRARGAFERYALRGLGASAPPTLHAAVTELTPYMEGMTMDEMEAFEACLRVRGELSPELSKEELRQGCRADVLGRPTPKEFGKWALLGAGAVGVAWLVLR